MIWCYESFISFVCFFFECTDNPRDLHVLTHSFPTRPSSDLSPHALAQGDKGRRQLQLEKRLAAIRFAALDARRDHRIAGRGKRQLVDYHTTQSLAAHVYAFPKTRRTQQHRITELAKIIQQLPPTDAVLH